MATALIRSGYDTWVGSGHPSDTHGTSSILYVDDDSQRAYIYWPLPFRRGATIVSASIRLVVKAGANESVTFTARRADHSWSAGTATWNNRPGTVGASYEVTVNASAGRVVEIPVTGMMASVAAGGAWYGVQVLCSRDGGVRLFGLDSRGDVTRKPTLNVEWSTAPAQPVNLHPSGVVSVALPTVSFDYRDGDSPIAAIHVQIGASPDTGAPSWTVNVSDASLPLSQTGYAGLAEGATDYWRVRAQDASGQWSVWSEWESMTRTARPVVTLTSPVDGGTVTEFTPPVLWSMPGQTAWEVRVLRDGKVTHSSGRRTTTETAYTLPSGVLKDRSTYRVEVRAWDNVTDRVSTPEAPAYSYAKADFSVAVDNFVTPPTITGPTSPTSPLVDLTWTSTEAPDKFTVMRDNVAIITAPVDYFTTPGGYHYLDAGAGFGSHTWQVIAVVNGRSSTPATWTLDVPPQAGLWLVDEDSGDQVVLAGDDDGTWGVEDDASLYRPLGSNGFVRLWAGAGARTGDVDGDFVDGWPDGTTASGQTEVLYRLRDAEEQRLWLVAADMAVPVVVHDVVVSPSPRTTDGQVIRHVAFAWAEREA